MRETINLISPMKTTASSHSLHKAAITRIAIVLAVAYNIQTSHGALHLTTANGSSDGMVMGGWHEVTQAATSEAELSPRILHLLESIGHKTLRNSVPVSTAAEIALESSTVEAMIFPWETIDTHGVARLMALAMFEPAPLEMEFDWDISLHTSPGGCIDQEILEIPYESSLSAHPWQGTEATMQAVSAARNLFGITPMDCEEFMGTGIFVPPWGHATSITITSFP